MSSIHNNRNEQANLARRAQADFQKKEQNLVKKHRDEINSLTKQHRKELAETNQRHENHVEDLKGKTRANLSRREIQFQQKVQEMRDMHRDQVRRMAEDNERNMTRSSQERASESRHV